MVFAVSYMFPTECSPEAFKKTTSTAFGPPFDVADADTILRSSDQIDFHVYRVVLSKSSSFFKSMVSLPQPDASSSEKQNPVIDLTENSRTIAVLLTYIYPLATELEPISLDDMIYALSAAKKYEMAAASQRLNEKFAVSKVVQDSPIEAFCAMYSHKLGEAARVAAKVSLKHRMNLDSIGENLRYTNGPALYQLWKFHRACSATAAEAVSGTHLTWITSIDRIWPDFMRDNCPRDCREYSYTLGPSGECWNTTDPWYSYITRAHNVLLEHPCREAVAHDSVLKPSYEGKTCYFCRCTLISLPEFVRLLGEEVENRVSMVRNFLAYFLDTSHSMAPTEGRSRVAILTSYNLCTII